MFQYVNVFNECVCLYLLWVCNECLGKMFVTNVCVNVCNKNPKAYEIKKVVLVFLDQPG
jgi:hypothetical protein